MKTCPKCGRAGRPHHRDRGRKDGLHPWCDVCVAKKSAEWHGRMAARSQDELDDAAAMFPLVWCSMCQQMLERELVANNRTQTTGKHAYCRACMAEYQRMRRGSK